MALIKSISGIRGTIGGRPGDALTPIDTVRFVSAYAVWLKTRFKDERVKVIIGRDARPSGPVISEIVKATLILMGVDVIDIGLATTPTVEIAVTGSEAAGGIVITASHNPVEWNALKLLNEKGEFLSAEDGRMLLLIAANEDFTYAGINETGTGISEEGWNEKHIDQVLSFPLVDRKGIEKAALTVVIDCVNSVGAIVIPELLRKLGVKRIIEVHCTPNGYFPHNPEPLPEHLTDLSEAVVRENADIGFAVDPDVDRLAIVCENGKMFGEEYTLVAVADYILGITPGSTVSNMSSSRALRDVTERYGCEYFSSPVGEVNVVEEMKKRGAVIGGEGNGGIIVPGLHYGRDALAGIALFLSHMVRKNLKCSDLKHSYPQYVISKNKVVISPDQKIDDVYDAVRSHFGENNIDDRDGIKYENEKGWVHLRTSNTEPVIRIYSEAVSREVADMFIKEVVEVVKKI